jgi:hypothetical protein
MPHAAGACRNGIVLSAVIEIVKPSRSMASSNAPFSRPSQPISRTVPMLCAKTRFERYRKVLIQADAERGASRGNRRKRRPAGSSDRLDRDGEILAEPFQSLRPVDQPVLRPHSRGGGAEGTGDAVLSAANRYRLVEARVALAERPLVELAGRGVWQFLHHNYGVRHGPLRYLARVEADHLLRCW